MNNPFISLPIVQSRQEEPKCLRRVPARVLVAMEFLAMISDKTADRPASNDVSVQIVDGQKLTEGEIDAQQTACHLLIQYFEGKLRPDAGETLEMEQSKVDAKKEPGVLLRCLSCNPGEARPGCTLCRGTGYSIITPSEVSR